MDMNLENLTIHGFNRVGIAKGRSSKVFWSLVVVVCFACAIFAVYIRVNEHYHYNVTQSVTRKVHPSLPFLVVTICNGLRAQGQNNLSLFSRGFEKYADNYKRFCRFGIHGCHELSINYKTAPPPLDQSCLVFNSNEKAVQTDPWLWSGLTIDFFLNSSDIVPHKSSFLNEISPLVQGARIFLHTSNITVAMVDNKILAKPGYITTLIIEKISIKRLAKPFPSNCSSKEDKTDFSPGDYTLLGCILSEWHIKAYLECGYKDKKFMSLMPYEKYGNISFNRSCYHDLWKYGFGMQDSSCKLPCDETLYKIESFSESKWPLGPELLRSKTIVNQSLGIVADDSFLYSNLGRIVIRFDAVEEVIYEEQPKSTLNNLSSDIGGSLGISLGASAISISELLFVFLACAFAEIKRRRTFTENVELGERNLGVRIDQDVMKWD